MPPDMDKLHVLSGPGLRFTVPEHYGSGDEFYIFSSALSAARLKLAAGHARAFVTIRIAAEIIEGIGNGIDRELARFEVYADRVVLVPPGQGGLSDEQKAKVLALPKKRFLITPEAAISYDDAVRAIAREVVTSADANDNDDPDNVVGRDEHALRVLIEGRLADDVAITVAELRKREDAS
jgi:hypothetical protein